MVTLDLLILYCVRFRIDVRGPSSHLISYRELPIRVFLVPHAKRVSIPFLWYLEVAATKFVLLPPLCSPQETIAKESFGGYPSLFVKLQPAETLPSRQSIFT